MPAKGQTSDTVLPKLFYGLLQGSSRPRGPFPARDFANDVRSFCASNRSGLLRQFTHPVKLRTTPRPAVPAAKRCRQHGRADYRRGRRIRLDRIAPGVHDFGGAPAVRRTPTIGFSGAKRCPPGFVPAWGPVWQALPSFVVAARLSLGASEKHPPQIVYVMLFGLGLGGSLLAGFGMAAATARSWIHMLIFAATLTVTLYAVTDMEYPRLGLIRIEDFDHFLVDTHRQMQPRGSVGTVGSGQ